MIVQLSFLLCLNIGAIIGSIIGGVIADKIGSKRVLMLFYLVGGISLICLAFNPNNLVLYLLISCCGAASIGAQNLNNACISTYFPPNMKSTALGTALGVGRLGAIVGPTIGGLLLSSEGQSYWSFIVFSIPAFLAFVAYACMPLKKTKEYVSLPTEISISK
ncbi:MAG: MFS transporter [Rummeliibacillus sp.]